MKYIKKTLLMVKEIKFLLIMRYADNEEPRLQIRDWMRSKEVYILFRIMGKHT